jgi:hypothetical protein
MPSAILFPNEARTENASYTEAFWRGLRDAIHGAKYNDGVNPEHRLEVLVPDVSHNQHSRGYRDGYLAGRKVLMSTRN